MTHKLLLADDSVTIQRVIELTFADEDIEVIAVGDGERAVQRIREDRPDIVLADVDMPERDGFAVAAFVKSDPDLAHIRVILLTGAFEPVDEARVRAAGCDGVLAKPFEPQLLIARVRELLAGSPAVRLPAASSLEQPSPQAAAVRPGARALKEPDATVRGRDSQGASQGAPPEGQPLSLDEYFDQLDAAFASHGLALEATDSGVRPAERTVLVPAAVPPLDATFSALLAAEQGESPFPPQVPFFSLGAVVDEVTRRVVERMADDGVREQVAEIVSRVADRLVREEIERVKASIK